MDIAVELLNEFIIQVDSLYVDDIFEKEGLRIVLSSTISDPWWNFVDCSTTTEIHKAIDLESVFKERKLDACIVCFSNKFDDQLKSAGFTKVSHDSWLTAAADRAADIPVKAEVEIKKLDKQSTTDVELFLDLNRQGFDSGDAEDPYSDADHEGFTAALRDALLNAPSNQAQFFIAYLNDQPAGVSQVLFGESTAGLYGGAVVPEFRNQGVGKAMLAKRAETALNRGYSKLLLQTEVGALPYKIFTANGFVPQFELDIWTKPVAELS